MSGGKRDTRPAGVSDPAADLSAERATLSRSMRLLHTADWHLGRTFHGASLLDAQAIAVDHVVAVARSERPDAIVLAGDVYDRALPPREAVALFDEALTRMAECCPVVLISGNHDSPTRLGYGSGLLDRAGVHVRTDVRQIAEPITLADGLVYCIPYLEPDLVRHELGVEQRGHDVVLAAAAASIRADRGRRGAQAPLAVVAHAFVAGAATSDSERDLTVGGSESVPASAFEGLGYVALGHLHRPQTAGGCGRYAGSPLAFSFSEAGQHKSLALVEVSASGRHSAELHDFPVPRPLARLRGTLDELLTDARFAGHEDAWVQATLTDGVRPRDAMPRLRERFPYAAELAFDPEGATAVPGSGYGERITGIKDGDLLLRFVGDLRGTPATPPERDLLDRALAAGRGAEAGA